MKTGISLPFPKMRARAFAGVITSLTLLFSSFSSQAFSPQGNGDAMLSGDFDVTGKGEAEYSLPISIPTGRAGLNPTLNFKYQSNSPNGYMGMGWQVAGLSSVYRCGKNLAIDGTWGGVKFDNDDRYCLDGERLIAVSGVVGGDKTEYRLEKNGYEKIISYGKAGNGPAHFKVWQKDGSVYEYGNTNDSKVELPGKPNVYKWSVNKITDITKQNHIQFHYDESDGDNYIKRISYVGGEVEFNYDEKREDKTSRYLSGSLIKRFKRLYEVKIKDSTAADIGRYKLDYIQSKGTQRSLLAKIQYCTADKCTSPIRFNWQSITKVKLNPSEDIGVMFKWFYDADRDGISKVYGVTSFANRNHDRVNVVDLAGNVKVSDYSFKLQGSMDNPTLSYNNCSTRSVENYMPKADGNFVVYCPDYNNGEFTQAVDFTGTGLRKLVRTKVAFADIDGDGKELEHGKTSTSQNRYSLVDINNDGYLDQVKVNFFGEVTAALFNGKDFLNPVLIFEGDDVNCPFYFMDINNDGYPEFFYDGKLYRNYFGKIESKVFMDTSGFASAFEDVNGDGWPDFSGRRMGFKTSQAFAQDKIVKIEEFGIEYDVVYKPVVDTSVHKQVHYYKYPIVNTTPKKYLVADVTKTPRGYKPTTYNYFYEGAKSHLRGYGFLGFAKITETENAELVTVTTTEFEQKDLLKVGKPISKTITKNGKKISETRFEYKTNEWQGVLAKYYQVYANKIENTLYDLNSGTEHPQVEKQDTTVITQDWFGNITHEVKTLSAGTGSGLDKQFKLETVTKYLSTGFNNSYSQHHHNVVIQDNQIAMGERLLKQNLMMSRYCSASGDIYFKPNPRMVLIHSAVSVPIVLDKDDNYYRYDADDVSTDSDSQTRYTGKITVVTHSEFKKAGLSYCGNFKVSASDTGVDDAHKNIQFSNATYSYVTYVTENSEDYWKLSAPTIVEKVITDLKAGLTRKVDNTFTYYPEGLLANSRTTGNSYGSGGGNKYLNRAFQYDDYGNVIKETVSGTDLDARQNITQYDGLGLFPDKLKNSLESSYPHITDVNYDSKSGQLTQSISPNKKRKTQWRYDGFGRLKSEIRPGSNNITSYQYKLGSDCSHPHPQMTRCTIASATERGSVVTQFDYAGREVRKLHQDFNGKWVYSDNVWDRNGRKLSTSQPAYVSKFDKTAAKVSFEYDERNRETKKHEPAANGGIATFTTSYEGLVTKKTDARGHVDIMLQNVMGHILRKTEELGAFQTYTYYPDGKLRSSSDAKGNQTFIGYDNLGYRSYLNDPDMGEWRYNYNALGELIYKKDANKVVTTIEYDHLGRKKTQNEGGKVSEWTYDKFGALGTLSSHKSNGNETLYYYNSAGLVETITMNVDGESFTSRYYYDKYERVMREIRPNGKTASNEVDSLVLEYVYNPFGYKSAVRSPKAYADYVFNSPKFRSGINLLIKQALAQAESYIAKAEFYKQKEQFFADKAEEFSRRTRNVHILDAASQAMLANGNEYRQWCTDDGECYFRPVILTLIHGSVAIPVPVINTVSGEIYRLETTLVKSEPGLREFNARVYKVSEAVFNSKPLTRKHNWHLIDVNSGGKALYSDEDSYIAHVDQSTRDELNAVTEESELAAKIASSRYQRYTQLAGELLNLVEQVSALWQPNCDKANKLAGDNIDAGKNDLCINRNQISQVDHLKTILNKSELAASLKDTEYIYYWQRRDTDVYDNTLSETLGNGLANTYKYNPNTGRLNTISTHRANDIFKDKKSNQSELGRSIRLLKYTYDDHSNVKTREDVELGITDIFSYDALDRLDDNIVILDTPNRHGMNNPDFNTRFDFNYDELGNVIYKTGIGNYKYGKVNAGPHAVTQVNGVVHTYDKVGNLIQTTAKGGEVERKLEWTAFNKPSKITRRGSIVEFFYDANHQRYKKKSSDGTETIYFGKQYEQITDTETGDVQHKQYIYADGKLIALNTQVKDSANKLQNKQVRYLHYDALGSIDMITDGFGNVVDQRSFDPWGKKRSVIWRKKDDVRDLTQELLTNRGFTGHEHIEEVGLIHMNGRIYDQELGRFLSADPIIQAPFETNSFNRYSYVTNNPLKYTDPTGFESSVYIGYDSSGSFSFSWHSKGWNANNDFRFYNADRIGPESGNASLALVNTSSEKDVSSWDAFWDEQFDNVAGFLDTASYYTKGILNAAAEGLRPDAYDMAWYTTTMGGTLISPIPGDEFVSAVLIGSHRLGCAALSVGRFITKTASNTITFTNKQIGKKLGKHVIDFGGNPSSAVDRTKVIGKINDIANNYDKIVTGTFKGQGFKNTRGFVNFRIKGNDVVVTKPDGSFVTVMKDGINNTSVKNALNGSY